MDWNELHDLAFAIASRAHSGQCDKAGNDYISHPLRVAERCRSPKAKIVALLHVGAVLSVTRREDESYDDYVRRASANSIGREVKRADLEDNMDLRRLNELTDSDVARLRKYLRAWHYLQDNESER